MSQNILKRFGEWGIKLKNRDISDYTRIQLKAFLELFTVAAYVTLAFIVFLTLRALFWYYVTFVSVAAVHYILFLKELYYVFSRHRRAIRYAFIG